MKLSIWKAALFFLIVVAIAFLVIPSGRELGRVRLKEKQYSSARSYLEAHYKEHPEDIPNALRYLEILEQGLEFEEYNRVADELLQSSPDHLQLRRRVAAHHEGNLDLEAAAVHWRKLSSLDPTDEESKEKLVSHYHLAQQYGELADYYREEIARGTATPDVYYDLARIYIADGKEEQARALYGQVLSKWPSQTNAQVQLAQLWEEEGRLDEALALYEIAAEGAPEDKYAAVRYLQKSVKYRRGHKAKAALGRYLARFPDDVQFLLAVATFEQQIGESDSALATIEKVQAIEPLNIEALLLAAEIYVEEGQSDKAIAGLEQYKTKAPEEFRVYGRLGDLFAKMSLKEEATSHYQKAVDLFDKMEYYSLEEEIAYLWIRIALDETDKIYDQSVALFEEYPGNSEAALLLFTVALHNRDSTLAEAAYEAYLRADATSPERFNMAAQLHVAKGEWEEARAIYEKIAQGDDITAVQLRDYALVLGELQELDAAIEQLERADQLDPGNPDGWLIAADLYRRQRNYEKALLWVSRYNQVVGGDLRSFALLGDVYTDMEREEEAAEARQSGIDWAKGIDRPLTSSERLTLAWTNIKLKEFEAAGEAIEPLLGLLPVPPEALTVSATLAIEAREYGEALETIEQLASIVGEEERLVAELRILRAIHMRNWNEAEQLLETALAKEPQHRDRLREYAFVSTQLQQFVRARCIFRELCAIGEEGRGFRWDQRMAYLDGARLLFAEAEMIWAEDGLRYQVFREGGRFWANQKLRLGGSLIQAHYQQLGNSQGQIAIIEDVFGGDLSAQWFPDSHYSWLATAGVRHLHSTWFPVAGGAGRFQHNTRVIELSGLVNELMFVPLNALPLETRYSRARFFAEELFDEFLRLGVTAWWEWYRLNPRLNPFDTGSDLGDKWFLEPFIGFVTVSDTFRYLEFFASFRAANWNQGFDNAFTLVDLLRRERAGRVGVGWRQRWRCVELIGAASEGHDWARKVNSVFLQSTLNVWWTNCNVGTLGFEYQIGDSGLAGQGNSWRLFCAYRATF